MPASLKVIALISGGKDSLYSVLHCLANGHEVVALANLHPPLPSSPSASNSLDGKHTLQPQDDMDSYMYQTVGHNVLPLYAEVLGIPMYRQEIQGYARNTELSYPHAPPEEAESNDDADETESLTTLLGRIMSPEHHPEANAIASGAILSTYQRTRVESVAMRLGLIPLAFLWEYDILPPFDLVHAEEQEQGISAASRAHRSKHRKQPPEQLLLDMAHAGLSARIIKVASGGLDQRFLWRDVTDANTQTLLKRTMARYGAATSRGSILGEGGEFETLVLSGPSGVWKGRIVVGDDETGKTGWRAVSGEGGSETVSIVDAKVEMELQMDAMAEKRKKTTALQRVRIPQLLDHPFAELLSEMRFENFDAALPSRNENMDGKMGSVPPKLFKPSTCTIGETLYISNCVGAPSESIGSQMTTIIDHLERTLKSLSLETSNMTHTTILLRRMSDFATINKLYGAIFKRPNPPARATVAVGDALYPGIDVVMHIIADGSLSSRTRKGLHVQSRSYWAPANIGPYSQAIRVSTPVLGSVDEESRKHVDLVHVAGQIPLEPASMELSDPADFLQSATLACQHLWRVGRAMEVKMWVNAVAFITASDDNEAAQKARRAGRIWRRLHEQEQPEDEHSDSDEDFDIADQNLRRGWQSGAADVGIDQTLPDLPDRDALAPSSITTCPPCFVVQVTELPRGADIEWSSFGVAGDAVVEFAEHNCCPGNQNCRVFSSCILRDCSQSYGFAVAHTREELLDIMRYIQTSSDQNHSEVFTDQTAPLEGIDQERVAVIPCLNVWSIDGERLHAGVRCGLNSENL